MPATAARLVPRAVRGPSISVTGECGLDGFRPPLPMKPPPRSSSTLPSIRNPRSPVQRDQLGLGPAVTAQAMQSEPEKVMLSETESPSSSPRADPAAGSTRHSMTQEAAVKAVSRVRAFCSSSFFAGNVLR